MSRIPFVVKAVKAESLRGSASPRGRVNYLNKIRVFCAPAFLTRLIIYCNKYIKKYTFKYNLKKVITYKIS